MFVNEWKRSVMVAGVALMFLLTLFVVSAPRAQAAIVPTWTDETQMAGNRSQAVVVQDANELMYIIGGNVNGSYTAVPLVNTYDPHTGAWASLPSMTTGVREASGVYLNGKIYVFSGYNNTWVGTTQIYDTVAQTWSSGAAIPISVWSGRAAVGVNGLIYVAGGYDSAVAVRSEMHIYDPVANSWSSAASLPAPRSGGQLVARGSYLYYISGEQTAGGVDQPDVFRYNVAADTWSTTAVPDMPVGLDYHAAAVGPDGSLYAYGGVQPGRATSYVYDFASSLWEQGPYLKMGVAFGKPGVTSDGRIWMVGGTNTSYSAVGHIQSMRVMTKTILASATQVAQGGTVTLNVSYDFTFLDPAAYSASAYILSGSGVVYSPVYALVPVGAPFTIQVTVPDSLAAGSYDIVLKDLTVTASSWRGTASWELEDEVEFPLTVTGAPTLAQRIAAVEAQIAALQAALASENANVSALKTQIDELSSTLGDLQDQLDAIQAAQDDLSGTADDAKSSASSANLMGMINLVLLIIVIVLVVLVLMGKKKP